MPTYFVSYVDEDKNLIEVFDSTQEFVAEKRAEELRDENPDMEFFVTYVSTSF